MGKQTRTRLTPELLPPAVWLVQALWMAASGQTAEPSGESRGRAPKPEARGHQIGFSWVGMHPGAAEVRHSVFQ